MPEALITENGQGGGNSVEKTLQVHVDHVFPISHAKFVKSGDWSDTSVADQYIELAETGASAIYERIQVLAAPNVCLQISCFTACVTNAGCEFF
jgi:hypothetical protein